jgi:hypothetical protein
MVKVVVSYTDLAMDTNPALLLALQRASDALLHLLDVTKLDKMTKTELVAFVNKHSILKGISVAVEQPILLAAVKAALKVPPHDA